METFARCSKSGEAEPPPQGRQSDEKGLALTRNVSLPIHEPSQSGETAQGQTRGSGEGREAMDSEAQLTHYRVYKRRWFGLVQLVLLNIIVSWDWLTFAPVSDTCAQYFGVSETAINWLSISFFFAFAAISPVVIWVLNRGPKLAIVVASVLTLAGNWIRYVGTRASGSHFGVVMFGQILTGFAQPFVLAAPTRYSDLWFTEHGRTSATAVASLANPFGGALGQLISPMWASKPSDVPNLVLYTTIVSSAVAIPSFFIPAKPPTPPAASSQVTKISAGLSVRSLAAQASFWLVLLPFGVYVGLFNAFSSLLNQILKPYGFTEDEAGYCGAILILVGLVSAAITSPLIDKTHAYLLSIKLLVPVIALSYLAFAWAPSTRSLGAPYTIAALLGASCFSLVPIALEYIVEATWPASPEVGSSIMWGLGQILGGIFLLLMDGMKGAKGEPKDSMWRALVFQAVLACVVVPAPMCLGVQALGLGRGRETGRLVLDERTERAERERVQDVRMS